jgi:hypothetical protein
MLACSVAGEESPSVSGDSGVDATPNQAEEDAGRAVGALAVGFAQVDVTPSKVIAMGGFGSFQFPAAPRTNDQGTHDALFASAIAFRGKNDNVLAIVSIDALGLSSVSVKRIRDAALARLPTSGVAANVPSILVAATHDHDSPDTMGLWGSLPFTGRDQAYMDAIEHGAADAVVAAIHAMVPATVKVGTANKPNGSSASATPEKRDDALITLAAYANDGHLLGTFTQWAAHPTILGGENNTISSDYVGPFRQYMTDSLGGTHVYVNGALGNLYAIDDGGTRMDVFPAGKRDPDLLEAYERISYVGGDLAERVQAAIQASRPLRGEDVFVRTKEVMIPIENAQFITAVTLNIVETRLQEPRELMWFRVGDVEAATVPGEMFSDGTASIRTLLSDRGATTNIIVGMGNEWLGYLMSPADYDDPAYSYHRGLCPSRGAMNGIIDTYRAFLSTLP